MGSWRIHHSSNFLLHHIRFERQCLVSHRLGRLLRFRHLPFESENSAFIPCAFHVSWNSLGCDRHLLHVLYLWRSKLVLLPRLSEPNDDSCLSHGIPAFEHDKDAFIQECSESVNSRSRETQTE